MTPVQRILARFGLTKLVEMVADTARPSQTGVRQPVGSHPAVGITPERLAMILRDSEDGDPERYLELAEDMEERDLHYQAVLGTRKRSVSQLDITVMPAGEDAAAKAQADFLRRWLDRDVLQGELFDMLDAIGKGFSVTQILWDTSGGVWLPRELRWVDPRWVEFDRVDRRTPLLRGDQGPQRLAPGKFIVHAHQAKSGLPIRGGLARAVAWAWMFKTFGLKDWVVFCETYGQPLRVGRYGPESSPEDRRILLEAVMNIGTDCAAIYPKSMDVEFIRAEGATANASMFQGLVSFFDQQISKAVLGQTTTTDAVSGGHAVSQEHRQVQEDIERADARQLAATLNDQLVRPIIDFNFGRQARYPRLRIGRPDSKDAKLVVDALEKLVPLGLKVDGAEVRDMLGLRSPAANAQLLAAPAQPAAPAVLATQSQQGNPKVPTQDLVKQLGAADPAGAFLTRVREELAAASSLADLAERLKRIDMPVDQVADIMAAAMSAAHLSGRSAVADEAPEN